MATLRIEGSGAPVATTVHLDDLDITPALLGLKLAIQPNALPHVELELELDLHPLGQIDVDSARVDLAAGTRDLLIKLGWTPPS